MRYAVSRPFNPRNTGVVAALIVIILLISAFQSGKPSGGVERPESLVWRTHPNAEILLVQPGPPDLVGCIKYCWFSGSVPSVLVVYAEPQQPAPNQASYGWELAGISDGTWHSVSSASGGGGLRGSGPLAVTFSSNKVPRSSITFRYGVRKDYVLTVGRVRDSNVANVAFLYDNGYRIPSSGLTHGTFAAFAPANALCEIRFFDSRGSVISTIGPEDDPMLAAMIGWNAPDGCRETW